MCTHVYLCNLISWCAGFAFKKKKKNRITVKKILRLPLILIRRQQPELPGTLHCILQMESKQQLLVGVPAGEGIALDTTSLLSEESEDREQHAPHCSVPSSAPGRLPMRDRLKELPTFMQRQIKTDLRSLGLFKKYLQHPTCAPTLYIYYTVRPAPFPEIPLNYNDNNNKIIITTKLN